MRPLNFVDYFSDRTSTVFVSHEYNSYYITLYVYNNLYESAKQTTHTVDSCAHADCNQPGVVGRVLSELFLLHAVGIQVYVNMHA